MTGQALTKGTFPVTLGTTNEAGTYLKEIDFVVTNFDEWKYELELNVSGYSGSNSLYNFPLFLELDSSINGFNYQQFADEEWKRFTIFKRRQIDRVTF